MFSVVALVMLPIVVATTVHPLDAFRAHSTWPTAAIALYLTVACTLVACTLMNYWQRHVSSTHASLIYCSEPLFTSVFALFVPAFISRVSGIDYPNECLSNRLILGGGLIMGANLLVFWQASRQPCEAKLPLPMANGRLEKVPIRVDRE